jgi:hypothetical protein
MTTPPDQMGSDDMRAIWQAMPVETIAVSADEMRARAEKLAGAIRKRNKTEYFACGFVLLIFGWYATWPEPATPLWPIANIMIIAGVFLAAFNMHKRARANDPPPQASASALIEFQRTELIRQRDALKTVWFWYVLPSVPGVILWFIAAWIGNPDEPMRVSIGLAGAALVVALVFAGIIWLNLLGAKRLQRQIDELDRYREKQ